MRKTLFVLLGAVLLGAGCRSLPSVYEVPSHAVALAEGQTMRQAILQGGQGKRWIMTEPNPGLIQGRLCVRGHEVRVNIPYTDNSYSITYADSLNMRYNAKKHRIHRKYNQWVRNLDLNISRFAQKTPVIHETR